MFQHLLRSGRVCACRPLHRNAVAAFSSSTTTAHSMDNFDRQRSEILAEASALTRSLYRLCMRSVKLIKQGNDADAAEFAAREEKQLQSMSDIVNDERLSGIISMLPPVEPVAELQARSEYYAQYTSENFFAESDCLRTSVHDGGARSMPNEAMFARYFYHLRKGEDHRQWLLKDMKFDDPFEFDFERVNRLEERVRELHQTLASHQLQQMDPQQRQAVEQAQHDLETYDSDEEAFSDDEDDDETETKIFHKNRHRRIDDDDDEEDW
eukprot:scaffold1140_cov157-Amphora_coffeaeformis.AAC.17